MLAVNFLDVSEILFYFIELLSGSTLLSILFSLGKIVCVLVAVAYFTLAERKVMASIQRRLGPNVVGVWGLLQPLADGLKLFVKEMVIPVRAERLIFLAAPI